MKDPNLLIPARINLSIATVGVGTLRLTAHLAGDQATVTVECPELMPPAVLLTCLASIQHFIREQTGAEPEVHFGTPTVEAL